MCADNGQTFTSQCQMNKFSCEQKITLNVLARKPCGKFITLIFKHVHSQLVLHLKLFLNKEIDILKHTNFLVQPLCEFEVDVSFFFKGIPPYKNHF